MLAGPFKARKSTAEHCGRVLKGRRNALHCEYIHVHRPFGTEMFFQFSRSFRGMNTPANFACAFSTLRSRNSNTRTRRMIHALCATERRVGNQDS